MSEKKTWALYQLYKTSLANLVVLCLQQLRSRRLSFGLSVALNTFVFLNLKKTVRTQIVSAGSESRTDINHVCQKPFWRWELRVQLECEAEILLWPPGLRCLSKDKKRRSLIGRRKCL